MGREVFVSYSQADRGCALELVGHLETQGIGCWVAPRDVSPAADWAAEIIDAISSARVMVLVFSASCNDSPQVRREVERAVHKQLAILPFRIEDVLPSKSLEYFLSSQHWLDAFPPPREPYYARLCAHLRNALRTGAPNGAPAGAQPLSAPATHGPGGSASAAVAAPASVSFQASLLQRIETALLPFVGPIAPVLIRRAAGRSASVQELLAALSGEIDSSGERTRFLEAYQGLRTLD